MGFRSSALFHCLRTDIASILTIGQIAQIESGGLVDPWPDATPQQVAAQMLLLSIDKKFVDSIKGDAEAKALEKFLKVNETCGNWVYGPNDTWDEVLAGTFKRVLDDYFYPNGLPLITSFEQMLDGGRTGPGASIGAQGNDFYTKLFSSRLSVTSGSLYNVYSRYVSKYPAWRDAELLRKGLYGELDVVEGNRVSFVPKSNEISRTICTEPSLNMFYQLGMERILLGRLSSFFGIDLRVQQFRNRELARLGSLNGGWSTIDLSSASDSISLKMLEWAMPGDSLSWFCALRSPSSALPTGGRVALNMVSTMGNGYTFALQCVLFSAVVMAAAQCRGVTLRRSVGSVVGNWGVNGDDIVVPTEITSDVLRLLKLLGFTTNASKTFVEGPFRESCGGDYFKGHSVRGVYLTTLDTQEARYVAINLLNSWTQRTGIALPLTVQYLLTTVKYQPVPRWENADAGVRVPLRLAYGYALKSDSGNFLYRKSIAKTSKFVFGLLPRGHMPPEGERRRAYNPWGLHIAFLHGSIVSGSVAARQSQSRYLTKQEVAPSWDYAPPEVRKAVIEAALDPRKGYWRQLLEDEPISTDVTAFHNAVMANYLG